MLYEWHSLFSEICLGFVSQLFFSSCKYNYGVAAVIGRNSISECKQKKSYSCRNTHRTWKNSEADVSAFLIWMMELWKKSSLLGKKRRKKKGNIWKTWRAQLSLIAFELFYLVRVKALSVWLREFSPALQSEVNQCIKAFLDWGCLLFSDYFFMWLQ